MNKGTITVKNIVENFNWTDVNFIVYKIKEVYFYEDGGCDGIYTTVVDDNIGFGDIEKYYDMKIREIDGEDSIEGTAVLTLWEDKWQYEEKAKQNKDWTYIV